MEESERVYITSAWLSITLDSQPMASDGHPVVLKANGRAFQRLDHGTPWWFILSLATCFVGTFIWALFRVTTECKLEHAMSSVALHFRDQDFHDFSDNWDRFHAVACEVHADDVALGWACGRGKTWRKKDLVLHTQVGNLLQVPFMVCTQVEQGDIELSWAQLAIPTSKLRDFCNGETYHFGIADMLGHDAEKPTSLQRDAVIIDCPAELRSKALNRAAQAQECSGEKLSSSLGRRWRMASRMMMALADADIQEAAEERTMSLNGTTWRAERERSSSGSRSSDIPMEPRRANRRPV